MIIIPCVVKEELDGGDANVVLVPWAPPDDELVVTVVEPDAPDAVDLT